MENDMWPTKEWRHQGMFELLRRGLQNRSFPLEPAITMNYFNRLFMVCYTLPNLFTGHIVHG